MSPATLVGAWALATVGLIGPWHAWHTVRVRPRRARVPRHSSAEIFFIGQLGKYVPGAIWPVVVQMRLARSVGVTRTRIAVSFVITLILGVATGLLVGMLAVPSLVNGVECLVGVGTWLWRRSQSLRCFPASSAGWAAPSCA